MANIQGFRLYDENGAPINGSNPLAISGSITVAIGSITVNSVTANIATVTATNPLPITLNTTSFTANVNTFTNATPLNVNLSNAPTIPVTINTITATGVFNVAQSSVPTTPVTINTITASGPLPVSASGNFSTTSNINTVTSTDLVKPTALHIYNLTMDTVSTWKPLTITAACKGFTINAKSNTTTTDPPDFSFAMTSTGSPFTNILSRGSYWDDNIILPVNTIFYFSVGSITNSVIQFNSKE